MADWERTGIYKSAAAEAIVSARASAKRMTLAEVWSEGDGLPALTRRGRALQTVAQVASNLRQAPMTSLLTTLTIALATLLFTAAILGTSVVERFVSTGRGSFTLSAFLREQASVVERAPDGSITDEEPTGETALLLDKLRAEPGVVEVRFKDRTAALKEFGASLGERAALLDGLATRNPLPSSIGVRLDAAHASEARFTEIAEELRNDPLVEAVQYSEAGVRHLDQLLFGIRWITVAVILAGAVLAAFIISNTIMLALYGHREEIEILRLMGASHAQIRTPYLVEGTCEGVVGGVLGVVLLYLVHRVTLPWIEGTPWLQASATEIPFLGIFYILLVIVGAGALGLAGAHFAVRRFSVF